MVEKVDTYKSETGQLFLSEQAAIDDEVMARLLKVMPELEMIRVKVYGLLPALADALEPMVRYRQKTTLAPSPRTTLECGCPVLTMGGRQMHTFGVCKKKVGVVTSYTPGTEARCPYDHPTGTKCPNCQYWQDYSHVNWRERAEDRGGCDCAAGLAGNGPPHHPTCPMYVEVNRE